MKRTLFITLLFFILPNLLHAASVSILAPAAAPLNKEFTVSVVLDTGGSLINSFDISIAYKKNLLLFEGYKEDNSLKKIWVAKPSDKDGVIEMSGIIPGGVQGVYDPDKKGLQSIPIVEFLFTGAIEGDAEFTFENSLVLLNDGYGTPLLHTTNSAVTVVVHDQAPGTEPLPNEPKDTTPPEPFTLLFIPAGFFSKTPSMIYFSTTDRESGVAEYQVRTLHGSWQNTASPMPAPRALIARYIVIRAVDFNGNARESEIEIPGLISLSDLFISVGIGIICYLLFFVVKRRR